MSLVSCRNVHRLLHLHGCSSGVGLATKIPAARLEGEVKIDEAYVEAGDKGQPAAGCTT